MVVYTNVFLTHTSCIILSMSSNAPLMIDILLIDIILLEKIENAQIY